MFERPRLWVRNSAMALMTVRQAESMSEGFMGNFMNFKIINRNFNKLQNNLWKIIFGKLWKWICKEFLKNVQNSYLLRLKSGMQVFPPLGQAIMSQQTCLSLA